MDLSIFSSSDLVFVVDLAFLVAYVHWVIVFIFTAAQGGCLGRCGY
jgi:hypothetical protein